MMVAMMVPGAIPATARHSHRDRNPRSTAVFLATYLGIWVLVGVALHGLYKQPNNTASGSIVIAAGLYELTPLKQHFRQRCQMALHSGIEFGLCCLGSSIGLMLVLVAVNMMSVPWMIAIAAIVLAQKILRTKTTVDVALALAIVALGALIVVDPSMVPGLMMPMTSKTSM
jgi:predicted metal-binding membrane protein